MIENDNYSSIDIDKKARDILPEMRNNLEIHLDGDKAKEGDYKFFRAPGRVNLIGGHTDYNDGFVLPVAIDRSIYLLAGPRKDGIVRIYSCNYGEKAQFHLDDIKQNNDIQWINYLQGVAYFIQKRGYDLKGMDAVIWGDVPRGAGLSSSAALEMVTGCAFNQINDLGIKPVELAHIGRRAENDFVGVSCGIMDQFISALGRKDNALFIDCRTHEVQPVPVVDSGYKIVVANTGVEHNLADTAYNKRRKQCQKGVEFFNKKLNRSIKALRDVSLQELNRLSDRMPPVIRQRCEHVIKENQRVRECRHALENDNLAEAGKLLTESHQSLRDLYEVSCQELDLMVNLALSVEGVLGARMTGAGFGGSTVNLVRREYVVEFKERISARYQQKTGIEPDIYSCDIVSGCGRIKLQQQPGTVQS